MRLEAELVLGCSFQPRGSGPLMADVGTVGGGEREEQEHEEDKEEDEDEEYKELDGRPGRVGVQE